MKMITKTVVMVLACSLALGGCGDIEGDDKGGVACTAEYAPVCSIETGTVCIAAPCPIGAYTTYSNQCNSDVADAIYKFEGECGDVEGELYYEDEPAECDQNDEVCGGVIISDPCRSLPCPLMVHETFKTPCAMRAVGAKELDLGGCGDLEGTPVTGNTNGNCNTNYSPVCGKKDSGIVCVTAPCESSEYSTYSNSCVASYNRAQQVFVGKCGDLEGVIGTAEPAIQMVASLSDARYKQVSIGNVRIDGDILSLSLGYSGCGEQHFEFYAETGFMESNPVQVSYQFQSLTGADDCDAAFTTDFSYDLKPLKQIYMDAYQTQSGTISLPSLGTYSF